MEEISKEVGIDMHTESLLLRAEQLARIERDKIIDKVRGKLSILVDLDDNFF